MNIPPVAKDSSEVTLFLPHDGITAVGRWTEFMFCGVPGAVTHQQRERHASFGEIGIKCDGAAPAPVVDASEKVATDRRGAGLVDFTATPRVVEGAGNSRA